MNLTQTLATGILTLVAFGTLPFMSAGAATLQPVAKTGSIAVIDAINSADTSQHLVWDMTYGD